MNEQQTQNTQNFFNMVNFILLLFLFASTSIVAVFFINQQSINRAVNRASADANRNIYDEYRKTSSEIAGYLKQLDAAKEILNTANQEFARVIKEGKSIQSKTDSAIKKLSEALSSFEQTIKQGIYEAGGIGQDCTGIRDQVQTIRNQLKPGLVSGSD